MNKTKKKILQASLALFNEHGLLNVSQRRITEHLKISPGNLTYHFKKKEDISEALYFEFVEIIKKEIKLFLEGDRSLPAFSALIDDWFGYMYNYRFIFFDLTNLMRMNPKIAENYEEFIQVRASIFLKIINKMIASNVIRKEEIPNEYEYLYSRLHIVSDYYLSYRKVSQHRIDEAHQQKHRTIFFHALYPYLTQKGKAAFTSFF